MVSYAVDDLMLATVWQTLYWLILTLFLAGVAQRSVNLIRPDWNWLVPASRFIINVVSLSMLSLLPKGYFNLFPWQEENGSPALEGTVFTHTPITWVLLTAFIVYWTINACVCACFCIGYIRYRLRRRLDRAVSPA